ncbi:MAG: YeeE/YedE thiosulfate transporter family protein [Armatimonadota bacterium]
MREKPYYRQFAPRVDWEWMLVAGVVVGAFVSALLSGAWGLRWVPDRWGEAFGAVAWTRLVVAFAGGVLMGLGARWANGCTSGHGISGSLQLALSGWLAAVCFFAAGTAAAMLIFGVFAG